jgi:hypothetical protein
VNRLQWRQKRGTLKSLPKEMQEKIDEILKELDLYSKKKNLA